MAIKASSFYLLPSLFWTLYTGQGKQGQLILKKFHFSPLTHTQTKSKMTWDRLGRHFLNFGA